MLHEHGPYGCHAKHAAIVAYNDAIRVALHDTAAPHGAFGTAVIDWDEHSWDLGSKTAAAVAWDAYSAGQAPDLRRLPCDILWHNGSIPCPWPPASRRSKDQIGHADAVTLDGKLPLLRAGESE